MSLIGTLQREATIKTNHASEELQQLFGQREALLLAENQMQAVGSQWTAARRVSGRAAWCYAARWDDLGIAE